MWNCTQKQRMWKNFHILCYSDFIVSIPFPSHWMVILFPSWVIFGSENGWFEYGLNSRARVQSPVSTRLRLFTRPERLAKLFGSFVSDRFPLRFNSVNVPICSSSVGSFVRRLLDALIVTSWLICPIPAGSSVSLFWCSSSDLSCFRLPIEFGRLLIWLAPRSSEVIPVRLPKLSGKVQSLLE